MFKTSVQAHFSVPMPGSFAFGGTFATVITLLVVPAIYRVFEDIGGLIVGKRSAAVTA